MIGRRSSGDEQVLRDLLERLSAEVPPLSKHALAAAARQATTEPRRPQQRRAPEDRSRPWRPLRLRWSLAAAAASLIATGLGFGFGTWLTPSGSAREPVVGLGFLPAKGWTVMQSGSTGSAESALAAAANVSFAPADRAGAQPLATLQSLPPGAIVIVATLTTRGDPDADGHFPVRRLPLRLADAAQANEPVASSERPLAEYALRAGVGGYNVNARITFGSEPTPAMRDDADQQIERLVVAPAAVTISVRPSLLRWAQQATLFGSVTSPQADEKVVIEVKECRQPSFRSLAWAYSEQGGGWTIDISARASSTFRATWNGETSESVSVQQRPYVNVFLRPGGRSEVAVAGIYPFTGKRVSIEVFDKKTRTWKLVQSVKLTESAAGGSFVTTTGGFRPHVPKKAQIRAVFPLSQAKPCYLAGYGPIIQT